MLPEVSKVNEPGSMRCNIAVNMYVVKIFVIVLYDHCLSKGSIALCLVFDKCLVGVKTLYFFRIH